MIIGPNAFYQNNVLGGNGFLPTDISDLNLWLDAADASTITEASNNISQWDDKSGQGNHAIQAVGSAQPNYDSINNNVNFNGTTDRLSTGLTIPVGTSFTIITRINPDNVSSTGRIFGQYTVGSSGRFVVSSGAGGAQFRSFFSGLSNIDSSPITNGTDYNLIIQYDENGSGSLEMFVNNVSQGSIVGQSNIQQVPFHLGSDSGGGTYWNGQMFETMVYLKNLNATELLNIQSYLQGKWG